MKSMSTNLRLCPVCQRHRKDGLCIFSSWFQQSSHDDESRYHRWPKTITKECPKYYNQPGKQYISTTNVKHVHLTLNPGYYYKVYQLQM